MSFWIFCAVLGAALLHAAWNGLIRIGASRVQAMMVLSAVQGGIGLIMAMTRPVPVAEVLPWLLASGLVHSAYKVFLTFAYEHGDLSRVYPLARGTAPMIVLITSGLFLGEALTPPEVTGIAILGVGILMLATGVFTSGESRRLLPYAFGAALATAGYSILDGLGARVAGDPAAFVGWMFVLDGVIFATVMTALRGWGAWPGAGSVWVMGSLGAGASYASYAIVVWAMTLAPIALVAALRETWIVFGGLMGWLLFRERMTATKALSVALIASGVIVTRL
mgnify:CR=1 FL=1